ncbi:MAG: 30S ribosomal protein S6 [Nitrospinae bacterium]|nr:30S ribosomal protein S6 [Nitrospinota bacterium]
MRSYQSILILKPDLDEAQVDQALEKVTGFLKKNNGSCLKVEKWGKKRLSYRVRKNRFGYYLNIYHTCDNQKVSSLETEYKLFDQIIKYLIIRLDDKELERAMSRDSEEDERASTDKEPVAKAEASVKKTDEASGAKAEVSAEKTDKAPVAKAEA